jgi:hypothetical protein
MRYIANKEHAHRAESQLRQIAGLTIVQASSVIEVLKRRRGIGRPAWRRIPCRFAAEIEELCTIHGLPQSGLST